MFKNWFGKDKLAIDKDPAKQQQLLNLFIKTNDLIISQ
jgi:hypothetical protein